MTNYQRGTDLKHCPDGCGHAESFCNRIGTATVGGVVEMWNYYCSASHEDTCPREKPDHKCSGCDKWVCFYNHTDTCPREQADIARLIADYDGPLIDPTNAGKLSVERMSGQKAEPMVCLNCARAKVYKEYIVCSDDQSSIPVHSLACVMWKERTNG